MAWDMLNNTALWNNTVNSTNVTLNGTELDGNCDKWESSQHALYQLANFCFVVAFLAPNSLKFHILFLRVMLCIGSFCLVLWAGIISCYPDILGWCIASLFINIFFLILVIYKIYPVKFNPKLDKLFLRVFAPMKMTRTQFKELCACGQMRVLPEGALYAEEGSTPAGTKLSILISGRLQVTCDECFLHYVEPYQFVDSPEYDAKISSRMEQDCFQVTIKAVEESTMLTWSARDLQTHLDADAITSIILHNLVGKDITSKLYQIQELLLSHPHFRRVSVTKVAPPARQRSRLQQSLPDHFAAADVLCPAIGRDLTNRPSFCEAKRSSLVPETAESVQTSPLRYHHETGRRSSCVLPSVINEQHKRRNSCLQLPSETAL